MGNCKIGKKIITGIKKAAALVLVAVMLLPAFTPVLAKDEKPAKVVRVGWFESPFNQTDEYGRRTGYAYEYQQKIAALTGWTYEYVNGSWSNLMQMLREGKIDILGDVSYTEERSEHMLFSSLPMGLEEYYLFIAPDNKEISYEDFSTLNGKKIGINKGSIQVDYFKAWAEANGVTAEVIEVKYNESETLRRLQHGDIDAYVSIDGYYDANEATPICRIGASDFYFAINKERPDLLEEINSAMNRIQSEDAFYNQKLNTKYIKKASVNLFLSAEELDWLEQRGTVRVGYQDNYLAFCAKDPKTGELTGALKDYLRMAANCLENARIDFEPIAYPTAAAAMEALTRGEVDCMFPANLTDYDGETQGYLMTHPIMRTDISAIVLESVKNTVLSKSHVTVAVNAGNPNYNMFLVDHFPEWRPLIFKDTPECLKAISEGKADCILMSNYRFNNVSKLCKKYGLTAISTGVEMDYNFAVRRDNTVLYSILNKVADVIPDSSVSSALSYYYTEDAKLTFGEMIMQNIITVISLFVIIVLFILFLIFFNFRARDKANESRDLITATETDPLTGLYSKNFFFEYAARMYRGDPHKPMDAIVINVEQFHSVRAIHGFEFGDNLIRTLGDEVSAFANECGGIAVRSEADHIGIYCPHLDNYDDLFDRMQGAVDNFAPGTGIRLRMGVMPWEVGLYPRQQVEQARIACNLARGKHTERIIVFDGQVRERENYKQRLKNDLGRAISEGELQVYYQPKYDISGEEPVLKSVEALVRWQHPGLGLIPPGDFIPLFEQDGRVRDIDRYVWEEACRQIAAWKSRYGAIIPVSVNLSRVDLYDPDLAKTLDGMLESNGLNKKCLMLEVTETAYSEDLDSMMAVIDDLCKKGYEIEMDDFGTGYSSLNMLSLMSINALKMDRGFIKHICKSEKDYQIVKVILDIAKALGIPAIAEGVETEGQLKLLKELGCDMAQGFYFSRPLPAEEFERIYLNKDENA